MSECESRNGRDCMRACTSPDCPPDFDHYLCMLKDVYVYVYVYVFVSVVFACDI